ncbi:hypothetical protein scyTo_0000392 [Scyliorhinus torazame]|uniref:Uncharacterized protein n=1 Tax=Scyliorhinus torazame TaxID=75743 RepID=A0A401NWF9_SCYTO|nr:hypothetical protein [Scyliorhinus torazame]
MFARSLTVGRGTRGAGDGARAGSRVLARGAEAAVFSFAREQRLGSALGPFDERPRAKGRDEPSGAGACTERARQSAPVTHRGRGTESNRRRRGGGAHFPIHYEKERKMPPRDSKASSFTLQFETFAKS